MAGPEREVPSGLPPPDLPAMFRSVAQSVGEALDAWWVELWTFAPQRDTIECRAFWCCEQAGAQDVGRTGSVIGITQSHDLRRLILTGRPAVRHEDDLDTPVAECNAMRAEGYRSRIDYPLVARDQVLGVLSVADAHDHPVEAADVERLGRLGRLAAAALDALAAVERQEERAQRLMALLESTRSIAGVKVHETVERVKADVASILPGVKLDVEVYERREDGCFARASACGLETSAAPLAASPPDALTRQAIEGRAPGQMRSENGATRLVVPLLVGAEATGYLEVVGRLPRRLRGEEVELVGLLAGQVAIALRNARVCRVLENRSATDPLTGLYSGWYFYERLSAEVARARRYQEPLALLLAEVDAAASLGGDGGPDEEDMIGAAARLLRGCLRDKVDVACHRGGGSFAVLLPNTPALGGHAGIVAERIRQTLEETAVKSDGARRAQHLTVSIAVAGFPTHAEDADDLATLAEAALTAALQSGGNRIVVAGEH